MKSFDELARFHGLSLMKWDEDNYASENTELAKDFFKAGQQSKQAEVDELQLKLSEDSRVLHNVIDIERRKCEELQKRIDEALHEADESCGVSVGAFVKLNKILKGNANDH